MRSFAVSVADRARQAIDGYANEIESRSRSRGVADRWLERVYDAIQTLRYMPDRYELAAEDAERPYSIRRLIIGNYLALYTILDQSDRVVVIGFRHGGSAAAVGRPAGRAPRLTAAG